MLDQNEKDDSVLLCNWYSYENQLFCSSIENYYKICVSIQINIFQEHWSNGYDGYIDWNFKYQRVSLSPSKTKNKKKSLKDTMLFTISPDMTEIEIYNIKVWYKLFLTFIALLKTNVLYNLYNFPIFRSTDSKCCIPLRRTRKKFFS